MDSSTSLSTHFLMNWCTNPTMSISTSSPPLSHTTSLNPHAQSWTPEAEMAVPFGDPALLQAKKLVLLPHEIYPNSAIPPPAPVATIPYLFHFPSVHYYKYFYTNEVYLCNNGACLQPQPFVQAIPASSPTDTLVSWSGTNVSEVESDEDLKKEVGEKKTKRRFVPPRLARMNRNMVYQGRKKSSRQEWMPKRAHSDLDEVISADAAALGKTSSRFRTKSSMEDFGNTTLMIKNIPNQYRRKSLMQFLDVYCKNHNLEYDFFYLPMDFRRKDNLGYAFVNFTTPAAAVKIMDLLEGFEWVGNRISGVTIQSKKICETTWAVIQGKDALVKHFQYSCFYCDDSEYLPVILSPPRNGSETGHLPIKVGILKGFNNFPRLMKKKQPQPKSQPYQ